MSQSQTVDGITLPSGRPLTVKRLGNEFEQRGYYVSKDLTTAFWLSLHRRPTRGSFITGPAGSGKSFAVECVAKMLDAVYIPYTCMPGMRDEDLFLKIVPQTQELQHIEFSPALVGVLMEALADGANVKELAALALSHLRFSTRRVSEVEMAKGPIVRAVEALRQYPNRMVVLRLDEWDKAKPSADDILLAFLQEGGVDYNGYITQLTPAERDRLIVYIPMNSNRDLAEPFLRRLGMIRVDYTSPDIVRLALEDTHPGHWMIDSAVKLYARSIMAKLPKPATIQELRQLLDSYTQLYHMGEQPDWNQLVFQHVTKTEENHALLQRAQFGALQTPINPMPVLDAGAFDVPPLPATLAPPPTPAPAPMPEPEPAPKPTPALTPTPELTPVQAVQPTRVNNTQPRKGMGNRVISITPITHGGNN